MKGTQACLFLERAFDKSRGQYMKVLLHEGHSASAYTHVAWAGFCFVLFEMRGTTQGVGAHHGPLTLSPK